MTDPLRVDVLNSALAEGAAQLLTLEYLLEVLDHEGGHACQVGGVLLRVSHRARRFCQPLRLRFSDDIRPKHYRQVRGVHPAESGVFREFPQVSEQIISRSSIRIVDVLKQTSSFRSASEVAAVPAAPRDLPGLEC